MKKEIEHILINYCIFMECDIFSNMDEIVEYIYDDIEDTIDENNSLEANSQNVAVGFRRFVESKQQKQGGGYIRPRSEMAF